MGKIFCKGCKHYDPNDGYAICDAPENMIDSYYKPNSDYDRVPRTINMNNDCSWYERKLSLLEKIRAWSSS